MKKRNTTILILLIIIILFLGYSFLRDNIKMTGKVVQDLRASSIQNLGLWIDGRPQGSYGANLPSMIRDDLGTLHVTYCSSSEPFDSRYAPDWRATAIYSTDSIRHQQSSNNATSWSNAVRIVQSATEDHFWNYKPEWKIQRSWGNDGYYWEFSPDYNSWIGYQKAENNNNGTGWGVIMRTQENLWQGPCSNVIIYFKGKYYVYFESYTPPSGILSVYVARANSPQGPYEIWTYDGWKPSPASSTWKPVIKSNIISIAGDEWVADRYKQPAQGNPYNLLYGAGWPRGVTQKDGKIYLYYIDTTYWFVWKDNQGNIQEYGRGTNEQIPYQLVAIGEDPTNLENNYENRMVDESGTELWNAFSPRYFPEQNKFYNLELREIDGQNKIVYRSSENGIAWTDEEVLINTNIQGKITIDQSNGNNIIEVSNNLVPLSNKEGHSKFSDLYLIYTKEHILPNAPIGWRDTPDFKWYYGGTDIYGLKLIFNFQHSTCLSFTYSPWTQCNSSALQSRTITSSNPVNCQGGSPESLLRQCSPPCLESNWQPSDSPCLSSNTLTRTWNKIGNCNQTIGINKSASETASCTYIPNVITCTNFTYSNWSECFSNGIQNRSLINSSPANCSGRNPVLTQSCNYTVSIINQENIITPDEDLEDNSGENNNYQGADNQHQEYREQTTSLINNKTPEQQINLTETNSEISPLRKFFIKFICKLSNLFNEGKYKSCIENYF
jgi:hypothetical protein